ncbi:MAG: hypothetical protein ACLSHC_14330 [Bilophila wadsworthia]
MRKGWDKEAGLDIESSTGSGMDILNALPSGSGFSRQARPGHDGQLRWHFRHRHRQRRIHDQPVLVRPDSPIARKGYSRISPKCSAAPTP